MDFILSLLGPKSVDHILKGVNTLLHSLEEHAKKQQARAQRKADKVTTLLAKINEERKDAERAEQVAARVRNLVS
jgi:hypothetical protein